MSFLKEQNITSQASDWIIIPLVLLLSALNIWGVSRVIQAGLSQSDPRATGDSSPDAGQARVYSR